MATLRGQDVISSYTMGRQPLLAVTAIILLATTELISPYHGRTNILVDRKKLRRVAITMGILFLMTVAVRVYQIIVS